MPELCSMVDLVDHWRSLATMSRVIPTSASMKLRWVPPAGGAADRVDPRALSMSDWTADEVSLVIEL